MDWLSAVVLSTLIALTVISIDGCHSFPAEDDMDESAMLASFGEFGKKIQKSGGEAKRTGRGYQTETNNHHSRPELTLSLPTTHTAIDLNSRVDTSRPISTYRIDTFDFNGLSSSSKKTVDDDIVVISAEPEVVPIQPVAPAVVALAPPAPVAPVVVHAAPPVAVDRAYSFTYASGESYRTETSDPAGNVVGEYQYWAGDTPFAVQYAAGPGQGFTVTNQEELDQNLLNIAEAAATATPNKLPTGPVAAAAAVYNDEPLIDPTTWERSRSYNFGYDSTAGASRQESADEAGTVTGSYQILDAQGLPLTVYYKAGAGIGFVVVNQDEVNARIAGNDPAAAAYAAAAAAGPPAPVLPVHPVVSVASSYGDYGDYDGAVAGEHDYDYYDELSDRSYTFGYSNGLGANREEVSNSEGYVKGSYSYLNGEGNQIKVEYVAGPEVGFVVQNQEELTASLVKATADGARVAAAATTNVVHSGGASVGGHSTHGRRVVIRKKPKHNKHAQALPITVISSNSAEGAHGY